MTTRSKALCIAAVVTLLAAGVYVAWPHSRDPAVPRSVSPPPLLAAPPAAQIAEQASTAPTNVPQREKESLPSSEVAARGTLVVRAHFARDRAAAADVPMIVRRQADDAWMDVWRARTDRTGTARFDHLPAGQVVVTCGRSEAERLARVRADVTTTLEFAIRPGLDVAGVVVDRSGAPVPDALIEISPLESPDGDEEVVATTDESGGFDLRDVPARWLIGARAAGFAASELQLLSPTEPNELEVRIELSAPGGEVDGVVLDPEGKTVPAAFVAIGASPSEILFPRKEREPPLSTRMRCDDRGRFHVIGVAVGRIHVFVHARGFAPFRGECDVAAGATASLRVALSPSATVRGVVRDADGTAVQFAAVSVGGGIESGRPPSFTSREGLFELTGLPAGEIEVDVEDSVRGKASVKVVAVAGAVVSCEIRMEHAATLRGRVVDEKHLQVEGAMVSCRSENRSNSAMTDRDGRFELSLFPGPGAATLDVYCEGIETFPTQSIDPTQSDIELVVRRAVPATSKIIGIVVAPDGSPVPNAEVFAIGNRSFDEATSDVSDDDGRFEVGPIAPGSWQLMVRSSVFLEHVESPHEILANDTWDAGTIMLAAGGWASITSEGDLSDALFEVVDEAGTGRTSVDGTLDDGDLRTEPLASGNYRLLVFGPDVAAQSVPFTIRAGFETRVAIRLNPGVRQRIGIALPEGVERDAIITLRVDHNGVVVVVDSFSTASDRRGAVVMLWLEPGDYTATASAAGHAGRATFTVGTKERPVIQIKLE